MAAARLSSLKEGSRLPQQPSPLPQRAQGLIARQTHSKHPWPYHKPAASQHSPQKHICTLLPIFWPSQHLPHSQELRPTALASTSWEAKSARNCVSEHRASNILSYTVRRINAKSISSKTFWGGICVPVLPPKDQNEKQEKLHPRHPICSPGNEQELLFSYLAFNKDHSASCI